jgi:hypothetical protein
MATLCYSDLDESKLMNDAKRNQLSASLSVLPQFQSYSITSLSDVNEVVMTLFSQMPSLEWAEFKNQLAYHLRARDEDIEAVKGIIGGEKGSVTAYEFGKLLKWFFPLVPEVDLRSSGGSSAFAWRISSMASLARQPWFHGFAPDAHKRLKNSPSGTFLVRFGSQAPHFILSMKDESVDSVVEWRLISTCGSVRIVESERFMNLQQLVDAYHTQVPTGASCTLDVPCDRNNVFR